MPAYHAKKRLGQNFLKTGSIIDRVVGLVDPKPDDKIVEIGSGRGALTLPLAQTGAAVWAIEFDRDLIDYLTSLLVEYKSVKIRNLDFLTFDPNTERLDRFKLVGNLPYNITSPVIDWCLRYASRIDSVVLMVQKELGARLAASPGGKDWSPLSIFTQMVFRVERHFDVAAAHFHPQPKVNSSVLKLIPLTMPYGKLTPQTQRVVRASFQQRRKLLVNNLVPRLIPQAEQAHKILDAVAIDLKARAEALTIDQFLNLTTHLVKHKLV